MALRTITKVGSDAAPGGATFIISETIRRSDKIALGITLPDVEKRRDSGVIFNPLKLPDIIQRVDSVKIPTISLTVNDKIKRGAEMFNATVDWRATPRSGTPNTDPWGDCWMDSNPAGLPAGRDTNHGNESPLPIDGALLAATQNDAFMEVDLTRFTGFTAPAGATMTFTIHAVQLLAVAQSFTSVFSKFAARPFVENTVTWNTQPADGTNQVSKTVSVLVGTVPDDYAIVLTAAEYGPFLGSWMMVRFSSTALLATPINISSREDATVGQRPHILFSITM